MTSPTSRRLARSGRPVEWIDDPLRLDGGARTARTTEQDWLRDLIRAVLFTSPGERPHRPDFGSGLLQLLFQPASAEVATTVHFLVEGTLQQWVGHLVEIGAVEVEAQDNTLLVTVTWTERRTGLTRTESFTSGGAR